MVAAGSGLAVLRDGDDRWAPRDDPACRAGIGSPARVSLVVDLLNDACDGRRDSVPAAIWRVVALAATSAGDVGITYAPPAP